jgi:hypothetical protein
MYTLEAALRIRIGFMVSMRIRIQPFRSLRMRFRIQDFVCRKIGKIPVSLGPHKVLPSYMRSLQPSEGNIQHFNHEILKFFYFLLVIFALDAIPKQCRNTD